MRLMRSVIIKSTKRNSLLSPVLFNDVVAKTYEGGTTLIDITANDVSKNYDGSIDKTTIDLDPNTPGVQNIFTVVGKGTFTLLLMA